MGTTPSFISSELREVIVKKTFLAAVLVQQKQPLELIEIEWNCELAPGQVLVKLLRSGICGSQLGEIDGVKGADKFLPHLLGHEGVGHVLAIGPGVTSVSVDDYVVLHWMRGHGIESATPTYTSEIGIINAGWVTTFNEYAVISENRCNTISPQLPDSTDSLLGCAIPTAFGAVENCSNLKLGGKALVCGAGGVGLSLVQALLLRGASEIVVIDRYDSRLKLAKAVGASDIRMVADGVYDDLHEDYPGGFDAVFDSTGKSDVLQHCFMLTNALGTLVCIGVPEHNDPISLHTLPLHFGKKIVGVHGGNGDVQQDIPRYKMLLDKKLIDAQPLMQKSYPLQAINDAIDDLRRGLIAGRISIDF